MRQWLSQRLQYNAIGCSIDNNNTVGCSDSHQFYTCFAVMVCVLLKAASTWSRLLFSYQYGAETSACVCCYVYGKPYTHWEDIADNRLNTAWWGPVQNSNSKISACPDLDTYLLQILIPNTFNSLLCQKG